MANTRPIQLLRAWRLVAALALGAVSCTVYPSVSSQPTYEADVRPIFLAHCTRCHGNGPDGGGLNAASVPNVAYGDAGPRSPIGPYLTQFGDTCDPAADGGAGTCDNGAACSRCGASHFAGLSRSCIHYPDSNLLHMPPLPAPPLDDWAMKVLDAWAMNPICSNAARPDPTICPGS